MQQLQPPNDEFAGSCAHLVSMPAAQTNCLDHAATHNSQSGNCCTVQALKKVMQTPRFANRRSQLAAEWEASNKTNGSAGGRASVSKLTRRGKAKAGAFSLPPEVEKQIEEQALSEVGS